MISNACVIYTNGSQECERILALLKFLDADYHEYKLNCHFTQRAFEAEFGEGAEYPQISVGAKHIGSLKETLQYFQSKSVI